MTLALSVFAAAFVGFILGHAYARWTRHCFIQSLRFDESACDSEPDCFWCAVEGVGIHEQHMRRDRVRRHTETHDTFPGEIA